MAKNLKLIWCTLILVILQNGMVHYSRKFMQATLTIIRYKRRYIPFAFFAMALHRLPLRLRKQISFYKLMGSGRNGTFDKIPDLQQWAILAVHDNIPNELATVPLIAELYGRFIAKWFRVFGCEVYTFLLQPLESRGFWDSQKPFGAGQLHLVTEGPIAVLTRATIHINKLKYFWQNVAPVAALIPSSKGFITSFGIGEVPWIKQATFSVWASLADMKAFAYADKTHAAVIQKTRKEKWYSEDMFVRFSISAVSGTVAGKNPLALIN